MTGHYRMRPARLEDARQLFEWRSDPATRAASRSGAEVTWDAHLAWLESTLLDPCRRLFVAEDARGPVGTVRADFVDGVWELSWTVSPAHRGRGAGAAIVAKVAAEIAEPICADVKAENKASKRIAESAGMHLVWERDGMLHFFRDGVERSSTAGTCRTR